MPNSNPPKEPITTAWTVITGGASSGKTTLCLALASLGYGIIPEAARLLIDFRISEGMNVLDVRKDYMGFQREVLHTKVLWEKRREATATLFLDRGMPDSCAYGLSFDEVQEGHKFKYQNVFFLEPVGFQNDYARVESEASAKEVAESIFQAYLDFGYTPLRVPKLPIPERVQFVLDRLVPPQ